MLGSLGSSLRRSEQKDLERPRLNSRVSFM